MGFFSGGGFFSGFYGICINFVTTTKFKTGVIKSDISDHFPIFFVTDYNIHIKKTREHFKFRRNLPHISVQKLKCKLHTVIWGSITNSSDTNTAYDNFIDIFRSFYDECLIKLKLQKFNNPWITKEIKESSKRKQKLYKIFLKNRNEKKKKKKKTSFINLTEVFLNPLNVV